MQITFIRKSVRDCAIRCVSDDGTVLAVRTYSRPLGLPHDLAHYIVERELGLAWGFWGLVAAGATFTSVERCAGRKRPHYDEEGQWLIKRHRDDLTEAESLVGVLMNIWRGIAGADWPAHRCPAQSKPSRPGMPCAQPDGNTVPQSWPGRSADSGLAHRAWPEASEPSPSAASLGTPFTASNEEGNPGAISEAAPCQGLVVQAVPNPRMQPTHNKPRAGDAPVVRCRSGAQPPPLDSPYTLARRHLE
jgi:hypothetical protein